MRGPEGASGEGIIFFTKEKDNTGFKFEVTARRITEELMKNTFVKSVKLTM